MPDKPYSPNNPHSLSTMKTELVWEGKYDEYGNRRDVDIAGSRGLCRRSKPQTSRGVKPPLINRRNSRAK